MAKKVAGGRPKQPRKPAPTDRPSGKPSPRIGKKPTAGPSLKIGIEKRSSDWKAFLGDHSDAGALGNLLITHASQFGLQLFDGSGSEPQVIGSPADHKIEILKQGDRIEARVAADPARFETGNSREEAVGKLANSYAKTLNLDLKALEKAFSLVEWK